MASKHILLHSMPIAWGHLRPLIALAVRIADMRPDVTLTILVGGMMYSKVVNELERWMRAMNNVELSERVRIVDFLGMWMPNPIHAPPTEQFHNTIAAIQSGNPLECASSHNIIKDAGPVSLAVLDPFCGYAYEEFRQSLPDVPTIIWWTALTTSGLQLYGPPGMGSVTVAHNAAVLGAANGEGELEDIGEKIERATNGAVITVPGLPELYDYEMWPQQLGMQIFPIVRHGVTAYKYADAAFYISSSHLEPEALEFAEKNFGKPAYAIGPILAPPHSTPKDDSTGSIQFLDEMKKKHGDNSVLYISFGSFFFPQDAPTVNAVLETLADNKIPFIVVHQPHAPPMTYVPKAGSDIFVVNEWAPQDAILTHPATGWFLSHGGWNSLQESFAARVPLILWPQSGDQPISAAVLTRKHHAAFELYSVRSGAGASGPPFAAPGQKFSIEAVREEVHALCSKLSGEEGAKVRESHSKLSALLDDAWDQDGPATKALESMLVRFVDKA